MSKDIECYLLDIFFNLIRVKTAVNEDLLDAGMRQELQRILYERSVCKR